ncbi:MAG: hypothetical protein AB7R55_01015 [Gemmatimonadales bacterium]
MTRLLRKALLALVLVPLGNATAQGRDEQFYYPGGFNWQFRRHHPDAARLFNAFDYGHAILYETLYTDPDGAAARLPRELDFLVTDLLRNPPRFAIAEEAVMPGYAKLAWRAKQMFDWAHVLHRQLYDVYADPRLDDAARQRMAERVTDYYLSNERLAFVAVPKSMALMDEQHFSQVFRKRHPAFNGLIWAYHWLQVGLYQPLVAASAAGSTPEIQGTLDRFWAMVDGRAFPEVMPMTPAVAPDFAARHPRAAIVFDNLHMMHDIISDILASDEIPRPRKAAAIEAALDEFQSAERNVIDLGHWRMMADHMGGVERMGGVAGRAGPP